MKSAATFLLVTALVAVSTGEVRAETPWSGQYDATGSSCDLSYGCCCLVGTVSIVQTGLQLTLAGTAVCGSTIPFSATGTLLTATDTTATVVVVNSPDTRYALTRNGAQIIIVNLQNTRCTSTVTLSGSPLMIIYIAAGVGGGLIVIAIVVTVVVVKKRRGGRIKAGSPEDKLHMSLREMPVRGDVGSSTMLVQASPGWQGGPPGSNTRASY
jgi:hypothetical protein